MHVSGLRGQPQERVIVLVRILSIKPHPPHAFAAESEGRANAEGENLIDGRSCGYPGDAVDGLFLVKSDYLPAGPSQSPHSMP